MSSKRCVHRLSNNFEDTFDNVDIAILKHVHNGNVSLAKYMIIFLIITTKYPEMVKDNRQYVIVRTAFHSKCAQEEWEKNILSTFSCSHCAMWPKEFSYRKDKCSKLSSLTHFTFHTISSSKEVIASS